MFNYLGSQRVFDASLDKPSTTLTSFPSLDANGMEDDLFKKKLHYPYEKVKTIELFFQPTKLGREDYFSTLKQSYPGFGEIIRPRDLDVKKQLK